MMMLRARTRRVSPFADPADRRSAGRLGMALFLLSLGILFLATIISVAVVRIQLTRGGLWPKDLPPLPGALWLGTLAIILSDAAMIGAHRAAKRGDNESLTRRLLLTLALGAAFMVIQALCWMSWSNAVAGRWAVGDDSRLALMGFYLLSGLHALHVIGGLAALIVDLRSAVRGVYAADRHAGVEYAAWYWHFLTGVWIVLFIVLLIGS